MSRVEQKITRWMFVGEVGQSSKCIASTMLGIKGRDDHPYDPDDLNRCLLLLESVPEIRPRLPEMAAVSPEWKRLIENWDQIERTFLEEVGLNWTKGNRAPRTYALMQEARNLTPTEPPCHPKK